MIYLQPVFRGKSPRYLWTDKKAAGAVRRSSLMRPPEYSSIGLSTPYLT
jgi:hypothetical protein